MKNLIASERFKKPIVTRIESACPFYEAEEEHQQFYKKDPKRMEFEESQGRKQFIEERHFQHWKDFILLQFPLYILIVLKSEEL